MTRLSVNPYLTETGHKFHKNWMQDKIIYKELTSTHLKKTDRELVATTLATMYNGDTTKKWVQQQAHELTQQGKRSDWFYTIMDMMGGRVGLLKYKGIEVALFFKRQITELVMQPGSPLPEHPLTDPDEVWQRLDLLGPSAKHKKKATNNKTVTEYEARELRQALKEMTAAYEAAEQELVGYRRKERFKQEAIQEKKEKEAAKHKRPFAPKPERDRLCMDCKCYENVHEFDKKGNCIGCTGGKKANKYRKVACEDCTFRPKGKRRKKTPKTPPPTKTLARGPKTRPRRSNQHQNGAIKGASTTKSTRASNFHGYHLLAGKKTHPKCPVCQKVKSRGGR